MRLAGLSGAAEEGNPQCPWSRSTSSKTCSRPEQKQSLIEKVTDAMVAVEGEAMRPVTWVKINEIEQGDWAIGGQRLNAAAVHAMSAGREAA